MSDMSAYYGDKLLNSMKGTAFGAVPATVYVSLWNGDPDSGGVEVTGTVSLTTQSVSWGSVSSRQLASNADITFGTASGAATVTYVVLADNATYAGHNQLGKKLITSAAIANAQEVKIVSGNLVLSY